MKIHLIKIVFFSISCSRFYISKNYMRSYNMTYKKALENKLKSKYASFKSDIRISALTKLMSSSSDIGSHLEIQVLIWFSTFKTKIQQSYRIWWLWSTNPYFTIKFILLIYITLYFLQSSRIKINFRNKQIGLRVGVWGSRNSLLTNEADVNMG